MLPEFWRPQSQSTEVRIDQNGRIWFPSFLSPFSSSFFFFHLSGNSTWTALFVQSTTGSSVAHPDLQSTDFPSLRENANGQVNPEWDKPSCELNHSCHPSLPSYTTEFVCHLWVIFNIPRMSQCSEGGRYMHWGVRILLVKHNFFHLSSSGVLPEL